MYCRLMFDVNILYNIQEHVNKKASFPQINNTNRGDFGLIGQFFLRLSLIKFTSGSGRLEKADEHFKKQQCQLA